MSEAVAPAQDAAAKPAEAAEPRASRPGVIQLAIREKAALQAAYMPFIAGGGLFIPSTRSAELGDQIYIILTLLDDPNKLAITGKVVWLTPQGVPGRQPGIGVQFAADDTGEQARNRIETMIGGARTAKATHTI